MTPTQTATFPNEDSSNANPAAASTKSSTLSTSAESTVAYLQSLKSIRDRCEQVYRELLNSSNCNNNNNPANPEARFRVCEERLEDVCEFVASLILRDYKNPAEDVPPHGRWRHFLPAGCIEQELIEPMKAAGASADQITVSLLDLFTVSVLLDAGAGAKWQFTARDGSRIGRSEGLALASMEMFMAGKFSAHPKSEPWRVDAQALLQLTEADLVAGLQVNEESNPLVGVPGRLELLHSLGRVCQEKTEFFGPSSRPGNLLYFLRSVAERSRSENGTARVPIESLWRVVIEGFGGVWPASRTRLNDVSLGDVWPCKLLSGGSGGGGEQLVPFHKLSQWLTYSLLEPMERIAGLRFTGTEQLTGLAEYRNGGLFVDFGVIELVNGGADGHVKSFPADSEEIVQWRALTVCLLDRLAPMLRRRLSLTAEQFSLPKMLEGGTWKAGREIAAKVRPDTAGPPINIISDGTLF